MRLHRFYIPPNTIQLTHSFWLHDRKLLAQWNKVLRFQSGDQVVLFDGLETERLYKIIELKPDEAHLTLVTDYERQLPAKNIFLLWSLLKKDKNDWVLQKTTELGISHFVPLLAERSEKSGFDIDRAKKIIIEAAEQCGRSDIPTIREPMLVKTAIENLSQKVNLYVSEQSNQPIITTIESVNTTGFLIGPEGGWSDIEKQLFHTLGLRHMGLGQFTLRAETAAIVAAVQMQALKV